MGLFGKKKKDVLDLTKRFKEQQEKVEVTSESEPASTTESSGAFGFLSNLADSSKAVSSSESSGNYADLSTSVEDRKQRLAKRLVAMTNKLEEISNQIYHLQQRLEVLEKKVGISGFE